MIHSYQTAGKCQIRGVREKENGALGEVIFIEIIEFDLGLKGCVWRKGSGGGHSSFSSFSKFICSLCCVIDTLLGTGHAVENEKSFCPYGPYLLWEKMEGQ